MAIKMAIQAPKTGLPSEVIKYRCEECEELDIEDPERHARVRHNERRITVDTRMKSWYGGIDL